MQLRVHHTFTAAQRCCCQMLKEGSCQLHGKDSGRGTPKPNIYRYQLLEVQCFLVCTYKEFGYFSKNDEGHVELDYGLAGIVTQESFDLTTKKGRDQHFQLALRRYECGQNCNGMHNYTSVRRYLKCIQSLQLSLKLAHKSPTPMRTKLNAKLPKTFSTVP